VKSEGEHDPSVRPPAPLVDGRLSWVGAYRPSAVVYRVAFGAFSAPASRWSLLLRALGGESSCWCWVGRLLLQSTRNMRFVHEKKCHA